MPVARLNCDAGSARLQSRALLVVVIVVIQRIHARTGISVNVRGHLPRPLHRIIVATVPVDECRQLSRRYDRIAAIRRRIDEGRHLSRRDDSGHLRVGRA